ncbi:hypothetical protein TNCV_4046651 [Trichonephila clavipes]|nr:hypothetical protein TNCV_4046651 [Trichonephila clavipes]
MDDRLSVSIQISEKARSLMLLINERLHMIAISSVLKDRSMVSISSLKFDDATRTATAGSDVVPIRRPIFDDFFQHLWPYIGNKTANVVFQMVKRLWLIRIDQ